MAAMQKDPVLVVVQLTGGNDYLNTVVPYNNPLYRDNQKAVGIGDNQISRSTGTTASVVSRADEEVLGRGQARHNAWRRLPRFAALAFPLHGHLAHLRGRQGQHRRLARPRGARNRSEEGERGHRGELRPLPVPGAGRTGRSGRLCRWPARNLWLPAGHSGKGAAPGSCSIVSPGCTLRSRGAASWNTWHHRTGRFKGADILKVAPGKYSSEIKYPNSPIARKLKGIAQVHFADLGTRVFYCDHGSFDTHAGQGPIHANLWTSVSQGLEAFMADLRAARQGGQRDHPDVLGVRPRVRDNGSGTDHGAAGVTFVIGERVKGGHYGKMPSLEGGQARAGRPQPSMDFRGIYSTILDKWLHMDPVPIVNGTYDQLAFLN